MAPIAGGWQVVFNFDARNRDANLIFQRVSTSSANRALGSSTPERVVAGRKVYWVEGTGAGCYYFRAQQSWWATCTQRKVGRPRDKPELRTMIASAKTP